jgi:ADP-heptose:LPS heptosyltransferase
VPTYLAADPTRTAAFRKRYADSRPLIGISWFSRNTKLGDVKSIRLAELVRALEPINARLLVLQYGDVDAEIKGFDTACATGESTTNIRQTQIIVPTEVDRERDLDGILAAASACDLVITVSNTVAHLAGAAGLKTLLLAPARRGRFWYWHTTPDNRSLWYPSVRVLKLVAGRPPRNLANEAAAAMATPLQAASEPP